MTKIIYTKHALQRVDLRRLSKRSIEAAIADPDKVVTEEDGKKKFIKMQGKRLYHVIAQYKPDQRAWLVISVWVRGEDDPQNYLWWLITLPFRLVWWLVRLFFGWR